MIYFNSYGDGGNHFWLFGHLGVNLVKIMCIPMEPKLYKLKRRRRSFVKNTQGWLLKQILGAKFLLAHQITWANFRALIVSCIYKEINFFFKKKQKNLSEFATSAFQRSAGMIFKFWSVWWCRTNEQRGTHSANVPKPYSDYKTVLCRDWEDGYCRAGMRCSRAHGFNELRIWIQVSRVNKGRRRKQYVKTPNSFFCRVLGNHTWLWFGRLRPVKTMIIHYFKCTIELLLLFLWWKRFISNWRHIPSWTEWE